MLMSLSEIAWSCLYASFNLCSFLWFECMLQHILIGCFKVRMMLRLKLFSSVETRQGVEFWLMNLLTPIFGKTCQKGIRRSSRWKTKCNRPIEGKIEQWNTICWWTEESNPDSGPVGQGNRLMVSREIGWWRKEKAVIKEKQWWRWVSPRLATGQESVFRRVLFYFSSFCL
jgi:hypothetical protein